MTQFPFGNRPVVCTTNTKLISHWAYPTIITPSLQIRTDDSIPVFFKIIVIHYDTHTKKYFRPPLLSSHPPTYTPITS